MAIWIVQIDGRERLMLEVREATTHQDIRDVAAAALIWRDRVFEQQGPWLQGGATPTLEALSRRHYQGQSYARLARMVSALVARKLVEAVACDDAAAAAAARSPSWTFLNWLNFIIEWPGDGFAECRARQALEILGYAEASISELVAEAKQRIRQGEPPFDPLYPPVARDKIVSQLRTYRQSRAHRWIQDHPLACGEILS